MTDLPARADIVIVGSGAGGGTMARALAGSGAEVLVLERGTYLPREPENWSPEAVFGQQRYTSDERWYDQHGTPFRPGVYYWVGGCTKVYGAVLHRLREADFEALEHEGGTSPAWPICYADLEPYYGIAESWYLTHGADGLDPTEPFRTTRYPFPPLPMDHYMAELAEHFRQRGLHPYPLPMAIDYAHGGRCVRCRTCDAFPCQVGAKGDAETCGVAPALADPRLRLVTGCEVRRVTTDPAGRVATGVEVDHAGEVLHVQAGTVIVAAGAVNSAVLLLRSANGAHPYGLANASGLVGRNYMVHNNAVLMAIDPARPNPTVVQKSFALNDFYFRGPGYPYPLGNLQPVGKIHAVMLKKALRRVPDRLLDLAATHSTDWWIMSEDLPSPDNRVTIDGSGRITVHWTPTNVATHRRFIQLARELFRDAGYPVVLTRTMTIETNSHQVGTLRFGDDPRDAVLDPWCRAHGIDNLYVVDASFFPSSSAVNPALTIMAQAIRVAERISGRDLHRTAMPTRSLSAERIPPPV